MKWVHDAIVAYAEDSAQALARFWDDFWFRSADPTLLGLIRILTGLMLLYTHAVWGLVLPDFFGPDGWLSPELMRLVHAGNTTFSFWWIVPEGGMWPAYWLSMAILALFTAGVRTRVTSVLAFLVTVSYIQRIAPATFGLDQINAMLTLYLAIGPSGDALSVDRWLAVRRGLVPAGRPRPSARANMALRLISVHMCVIYFFAGMSKLQGESWWTGEAMWRAFANLEYQSRDMTWLAWHPRVLELITHVSVLWEVTFWALVWRPRLRPLMLAGAVVLHVGIGACLGMWTFGLIMLVGCASFLPPDAVGRFFAGRSPSRRGPDLSAIASPTFSPGGSAGPGRIEAREPVLVSGGSDEFSAICD